MTVPARCLEAVKPTKKPTTPYVKVEPKEEEEEEAGGEAWCYKWWEDMGDGMHINKETSKSNIHVFEHHYAMSQYASSAVCTYIMFSLTQVVEDLHP